MTNVFRHVLLPLFLCLLALSGLAAAQGKPALPHERAFQGLEQADEGIVKEIPKTDMILLDNNRRYRIDSVRVPPDYSQMALKELEAALLNRKARVYKLNGKKGAVDRYGLPAVQILREDGFWVQAGLLSKGLAWFDASSAGKEISGLLRDRESQARAQRQGFWSNPIYAVKTPENVGDYIDSYQIVEGKALYATAKGDYAYVNFGRDWKTDFTIDMPRRAWRDFTVGLIKDEFDNTPWNGRMVRIRGWVQSKNGPMIELTDPEQIEFLKQE